MSLQTLEYVILATSHEVQDSSRIGSFLVETVQCHSIRMIAEEYPLDTLSVAFNIAKRLHIAYLQIDPLPDEYALLDIRREMEARRDHLGGQDIRLSHADAVREEFWLERIEENAPCGPVLIICGYLHAGFLAQRVKERGGTVSETIGFPPELLNRSPSEVLSPAQLEERIKRG